MWWQQGAQQTPPYSRADFLWEEKHKPSSLAKETQNPADPREQTLSCGATVCEGSTEKYSILW